MGLSKSNPLSQRHIQRHHHRKTGGKEDAAYVGMRPLRHLRDQLLYHHIDHSPCRKAQKIRQKWHYKTGRQKRKPGS